MAQTNDPGIFTFYDTETSGTNADFDQILQAAMVRTDSELNIIPGSEKTILTKPRLDAVPHPEAYCVHHLDIDNLISEGVREIEMARELNSYFTLYDNNCISGYNTQRFDDELVRKLFFRNLLEPYDHEWRNGNFRMDVFKLVQMMYALRPDTLEWPTDENGDASLKLANLSVANGIEHANAHDAMADVLATIEIARKIKSKNPKAWQYFLSLSNKKNVSRILNQKSPLLHVNSIFGKTRKYGSLILPVTVDKLIAGKILCVDLMRDPTDMLNMSAEDIKKYLFTKRSDLPANSPDVPAISLQCNKAPLLFKTQEMLTSDVVERLSLDLDLCAKNAHAILADTAFTKRLQEAFVADMPPPKDAFATLYSGSFISSTDRRIRAEMHLASNEDISKTRLEKMDTYAATEKMGVDDRDRQFTLLLRAKWLNYYDDLLRSKEFSPNELKEFTLFLEQRLFSNDTHQGITINEARDIIAEKRMNPDLSEQHAAILNKLETHYDQVERFCRALRRHLDTNLVGKLEKEVTDNPSRFTTLNGEIRFTLKGENLLTKTKTKAKAASPTVG